MTENKVENGEANNRPKRTAAEQKRIDDAVAELNRLGERTTLAGISWKELRDAGRK